MEKLIEDIEELKNLYKDIADGIIFDYINNEIEESHDNVLLFKKRIKLIDSFISSLNQIINNNTSL